MASTTDPDDHKGKPGRPAEHIKLTPEQAGEILDGFLGKKPKANPKSGGGGQGPPLEPDKKPKPS
jgi:hypothetical protein